MEESFFKLKPFHKNITESEIIADLQRVSAEINSKTVKYADYEELGKFSTRSIETRFGTFSNALIRAGLVPGRLVNVSTEDLFANLEAVWIKLGRQPSASDLRPPVSAYASGRYARRFGSWRKGLESFVAHINQEERNLAVPDQPVNSAAPEPRAPSLRLRFLVMKRDNFKCQYCGRSPATDANVELHLDHVIPWSKGGKTDFENLKTACAQCNLTKSDLIDST